MTDGNVNFRNVVTNSVFDNTNQNGLLFSQDGVEVVQAGVTTFFLNEPPYCWGAINNVTKGNNAAAQTIIDYIAPTYNNCVNLYLGTGKFTNANTPNSRTYSVTFSGIQTNNLNAGDRIRLYKQIGDGVPYLVHEKPSSADFYFNAVVSLNNNTENFYLAFLHTAGGNTDLSNMTVQIAGLIS